MMEARKTEVIKEQKLGKCGPGRYSDAPQRKQIRLDQPQFGLVLEVLNHSRDVSIRLQSGYCFTTAIGNLIPVASGQANSMDSQGSS